MRNSRTWKDLRWKMWQRLQPNRHKRQCHWSRCFHFMKVKAKTRKRKVNTGIYAEETNPRVIKLTVANHWLDGC